MTGGALLTDLEHALARLNADEREVVLRVAIDLAHRVAAAAPTYGSLRLDTDPRDFADEARFELLDGVWYAAAARVRAERLAARAERVTLPDTRRGGGP